MILTNCVQSDDYSDYSGMTKGNEIDVFLRPLLIHTWSMPKLKSVEVLLHF